MKEAAYAYLLTFRGSLADDQSIVRFFDRRAEAMRRARMAGLTYAEIGRALDIGGARVAKVIRKAIAEGQNVKTGFAGFRAPTRAESAGFIRMNVTPLAGKEWGNV